MFQEKWTKTKYAGIYMFTDNFRSRGKCYVGRFKIAGKEYRRYLGSQVVNGLTTFVSAVKIDFIHARALSLILTGNTNGVATPTLNKFFDEYIETKQYSVSSHYIKNIQSHYKKHIAPQLGGRKLNTITESDVQKIVNGILAKGKKERTAKATVEVLKPIFKLAIKRDITKKNPALEILLPKFDNKIYFEMPMDKARKLYKTILEVKNPIYRALFIWLMHGRRLNEVLTLRWGDIDFGNKSYVIRADVNKARRTMRYILRPLQIKSLRDLGATGESDEYIFVNQNGKRIGHPRHQWTAIKMVVGVEMRLHDLRHLIGFVAVNYCGETTESVAKTLGHIDSKTSKRYINVRAETADILLGKVFKLLGSR